MTRFEQLLRRREDLDNEIEREAQRIYPRGCWVSWKHGRHVRRGEIISHGYNLRMKVRTPYGAEVWREASSFRKSRISVSESGC